MQETYKKIFEMACREVPHRHFNFMQEQAVIYRGFKISLKGGTYHWEDTRNSNYYELVDPVITENILKRGFFIGLTLLMIHTDEEKVHILKRDIFQRGEEINYWTSKSSENWRNLKNQEKALQLNSKLDPVQKQSRLQLLTKDILFSKKVNKGKQTIYRFKRQRNQALPPPWECVHRVRGKEYCDYIQLCVHYWFHLMVLVLYPS